MTRPQPRKAQQNQSNPGFIAGLVGKQPAQEEDQDPVSAISRLGCTVFMPDKRSNKLDWDYLAGYDKVKRNIEDTVLLALTHGHVYD